MRGRKPVPNAVKKLTGSKYYKPNEPEVGGGKPACPRWLSKEGKSEWRYVANLLHEAGLLTKLDRMALAAYCEAVAVFRKMSEILAETGAYATRTHNDNLIQSPEVQLRNKAMDQMLKFMTEFGMTPSSRTRFATDEPEVDPAAELFSHIEAMLDKD